MRIVGGTYRGKKLALPEDEHIRPTADRTREALFNILGHGSDYRTENGPLPMGARVLDVFSGTGALGMEALSRGATHVTFIDNHVGGLKLVKQNIEAFDLRRSADMLMRDGTAPGTAASPADLVLLDPPYNKNLAEKALTALLAGRWVQEGTICVVELAAKEKFECPAGFEMLDERKYGAARLIFLKTL